MRWSALLVSGMLAACGSGESPGADRAPEPPALDPAALVDGDLAPAVAGEDGWDYALTSEADLTGDGVAERVVLTARVEMYRGRPAWDDGQPWQVYLEAVDGTRRYLYAQRLQLGTLTLRVALPDSTAPATLILLEHLPDRLRVFEVLFDQGGGPTVHQVLERQLDPVGQAAAPQLP